MKRQIRKEVFETNSSSVHSIVVSSVGLEESKLTVNQDNEIVVELGEFGCSGIYSSQDDKLSYLITCLYYLSYSNTITGIYDMYEFKLIRDAVCEYSGAKNIVISPYLDPYIDHQSIPYSSDDLIVNVYYKDSIINFVFNKYALLECDMG